MNLYDAGAIGHPIDADSRGHMEKELQAKATLFFITFFSQLRSNALDSWNRGISLRATLPKIS